MFKTKMSTGLVSPEASLGSRMPVFSLCSHMISPLWASLVPLSMFKSLLSSLYKDESDCIKAHLKGLILT